MIAAKNLRCCALLGLALCLLLSGCIPAGSPAPTASSSLSSGGARTPPASAPAAKPATPTHAQPADAIEDGGPPPPILKSPIPGSLSFELIQAGAPADGAVQPFFTALRGDQAGQSVPAGLPAEARQALETALARGEAALILALYAGEKPSGGFSVQIKNLTLQQEGGGEILLVQYYVLPPDPQTGSATVLTYPYLIVKLVSALLPEQVLFEAVAP